MSKGWKKAIGWIVTGLIVISSCMTISTTMGWGSEDKAEDTSTETAQVQVIE